MLFTLVDGEEDEPLDAHRLCGLDECHLAVPIHLAGGTAGGRREESGTGRGREGEQRGT